MAPVPASRTVGMSGNSIIAWFLFGLLFVIQPALAVSEEDSKCHPVQGQDSDTNPVKNRERFEYRITVADKLRLAAASAGAEWLETEGLLARARIEADSDSWDTALQLVQKACRQAELALQQAEYESKAWKNRVVD